MQLRNMRREESLEACRIAGFTFHDSIAHDMEVMYDRSTLRRLVAIVREVKPQMAAPALVLAQAPVYS